MLLSVYYVLSTMCFTYIIWLIFTALSEQMRKPNKVM